MNKAAIMAAIKIAKDYIDSLSDDEFKEFISFYVSWFEDVLPKVDRKAITDYILSTDPIFSQNGMLECLVEFKNSRNVDHA